jgi:nucleoside-diphosphate-sugar epimerase
MNVLFIGGTGIISSACTQLALERGLKLTLLNRGRTTSRPIPPSAELLTGDITDPDSIRHLLGDRTFDVVVNWIAYSPDDIERDLALFTGRTHQYIFISSASAYQTPPTNLPITESTPLFNPIWQYSQNKIACEERLLRAYREADFPMTVVRPSHTYDASLLPFHGGYTIIDRLRKGKPIIVHGDGTSLWTLTHHRDFAKGFVGLLGNPHAIGEAIHITSDELLSWNQIAGQLARAANTVPSLVHIPSDFIAAFDPDWGDGLRGDKAHSMIFDNSKIKRLVPDFSATIPFARGAAEIVAWYDADPDRRQVDHRFNEQMDKIIAAYQAAWP